MKTKRFAFILTAITILINASPLQAQVEQTEDNQPIIEETTSAPMSALTISKSIHPDSLIFEIDKLFNLLLSCINTKGLEISGASFVKYTNFTDSSSINLEAGIPVGGTVEITGNKGITFQQYPVRNIVKVMYYGDYKNLKEAYNVLGKYVKTNKIPILNEAWEVYLKSPATESEPAAYETMVYFVMKK